MWKAFGVMCLTGARALVLHHTDATSSECLPTTSMRLRADTVGQIGNGGVIDSFHGRERKRVGGDDLYVSIVEDGFDVAVAHVNDLADGSYELFFERVEMPAPRAPPRASHRKDTAQPAQLRVVLQFSCGIGRLSPPLKQWWNDSGWIRQTLPLRRAQGAPSSQALVPAASLAPASPSLIDLHRFAAIAAIGDSTLRMFRPLDSTQVPQLHFTDCSGAMNWRPGMCQDAANAALKAQGGRSHGSRQLVIFGSGSWDILDSRGFSPRRDTSSTTLEQYKVQFTKCLRDIRRVFPGATFLMKSLFALHPHRVECDKAALGCTGGYLGVYSCGTKCLKRTRYLSMSRARLLFEAQEAVAVAEGVTTLKALHSLSARHAHKTVQGDGLHYTPQFNDYLWGYYFTPRPRFGPRCASQAHENVIPQVHENAIPQLGSHAGSIARQGCEPALLVSQHSNARCRADKTFGLHPERPSRPQGQKASLWTVRRMRRFLDCAAPQRVLWVRGCRGLFRCGDGPVFECGFPPGARDVSFNCSCDGKDSQLYRWPSPSCVAMRDGTTEPATAAHGNLSTYDERTTRAVSAPIGLHMKAAEPR